MRTAEEYIEVLPGVHHPDFFKKLEAAINLARIEAIKECALKVGVENQSLYQSILSLINIIR